MKDITEIDEKIGRWTKVEHRKFLEGLKMHGRNWKLISDIIKTRSSTQVRSHAQKYFIREANRHSFVHVTSNYIEENIRIRDEMPKKYVVKSEACTQYGEGMIFPGLI
ncbi:hypothetical protein SteCoe_17979 [Stentor coeruleus]|uniref:Uncharacterized protein n=1 Tax=Stentor coeruleus TaxID=5963 RepID=A0A1R2BXM4_9CILI|nr:hypothetical protein SteCoe_17979 [Stentor coeruleus]